MWHITMNMAAAQFKVLFINFFAVGHLCFGLELEWDSQRSSHLYGNHRTSWVLQTSIDFIDRILPPFFSHFWDS